MSARSAPRKRYRANLLSARFLCVQRCIPSNENKMSDSGRERASLGVEVWKSSQREIARRSAVRSIAWLGLIIRRKATCLSASLDVCHHLLRILKLGRFPNGRSRLPTNVDVRPLPVFSPCFLSGLGHPARQLCFDSPVFGVLPTLVWCDSLDAGNTTMTVEPVLRDCARAAYEAGYISQGDKHSSRVHGPNETQDQRPLARARVAAG